MNRLVSLLFVCTAFVLVACEPPEVTTDGELEIAEDRGIPSENPESTFTASPFSDGFVTDSSGVADNSDQGTDGNGQGTAGTGGNTTPGGNGGFGGDGDGNTGGTSGNNGTAPVEDTGLSCSEIFDEVGVCGGVYETCLDTCQDQACADQCYTNFSSCADLKVADGTALAQSQYNDMTACEQTNYDSCYAEGGVVYEGCAASCGDEACAAGCNEDATPPSSPVWKGCAPPFTTSAGWTSHPNRAGTMEPAERAAEQAAERVAEPQYRMREMTTWTRVDAAHSTNVRMLATERSVRAGVLQRGV